MTKTKWFVKTGFAFLLVVVMILGYAGTCKKNSKDATTTGNSVWSVQVGSPTPSDEATNIPVNQQLSWESASGATSYDVYFGTTNQLTTAEFKINTSSTTYNPGILSVNTTYYWRVDSKNSSSYGTTKGNVWSFTTQGMQPLNNANLSTLTISAGTLNPVFSPEITSYNVMIINDASVTITPTVAEIGAAITVNGVLVPSGQPSDSILLNPGPNTIIVIVTAPDAVTTKTYTIVANRLSQQAYIKASNTGGGDYFGYSVAISGDTLVVGADSEDSNATGINGNQSDNSASYSGAVYVFTRTGTDWSQQAYIKASNTDALDTFGSSVAISGDTLVVGACGESSNATGINGDQANNSAPNSGAVYVFIRSGITWSQQAYIKASNTESNDWFGDSVAISGDTLVVGASGESSNATGINGDQANNSASIHSGAVYVFTRTGTDWSQQAYIKASNTDALDAFGSSVAISGDTLVVGAYGESSNATGINGNQSDNSASSSGAVYVFTRTGTDWSQQAYIKASNTESSDWFGDSVAISGDTLVVGATREDSNATGINGNQSDNSTNKSGAVYVFTRTGTDWSQQAYIKASNTDTNDRFGYSVAISCDTLVVGATGEDSNATGINGNQSDNSAVSSGAAYVFTRTGTNWSQQAYIKASNTETDDYFGVSVAISGDTLAVGADGEDSNATGINGTQSDNSLSSSSAVYVFQ